MFGRLRVILAAAAATAAACPGTTATASAQVQTPAAMRVISASPNGPVPETVREATIRFSEPMAPLGGGEVDRVSFVSISPAIEVGFRWADSEVLVVTPRAGRFPYATTFTLRVDAGATATSGRRLDDPYVFTFTTPAPQLDTARLQRRIRDGKPTPSGTDVVLEFDQPVRAADVLRHISLTVQPGSVAVPPLSPAARERLARLDPEGLQRYDEWVRRAAQSTAVGRVLEATLQAGTGDGTEFVLELRDDPPPGADVIVSDTGVASTEGPLRRETPGRETLRPVRQLFTVTAPVCNGLCDPDTVALVFSLVPRLQDLRAALTVSDVTDAASERLLPPGPSRVGSLWGLSAWLANLGYVLQPGHRYAIGLSEQLSVDGQRLGGPWAAVFDVGYRPAIAALATQGDAVWERALGPRVPVLTRSLADVRASVAAFPPSGLNEALRTDRQTAAGPYRSIATGVSDDSIHETSVDLSPALSAAGTGIVRLSIAPGTPIPGVAGSVTQDQFGRPAPRNTVADAGSSAVIQVTNLGITVRSGAYGFAVLVTRLDTGEPVPNASVALLDRAKGTFWRGRTRADGLAMPEATAVMRDVAQGNLVVVEHAGDVAFAQIHGAGWSSAADASEVVGVLFTDRGIYRPGEEVHVKAFLQRAGPRGLRPIVAGTPVTLTLEREDEAIAQFRAVVGATGGAEWRVPIAADSPTDGYHELKMRIGEPDADLGDYDAAESDLDCPLTVAAVRPVEFQVGVEASAAMSDGPPAIDVRVTARDLSDVALAMAPAEVTVWRSPLSVPPTLAADSQFAYLPSDSALEERSARQPFQLRSSGAIDARGELAARFPLPEGLAGRGVFQIIARVRDTSSQEQQASTRLEVPVEAYLGIGRVVAAPANSRAIRLVVRSATGGAIAGVPLEIGFRQPDDGEDRTTIVRAVSSDGPVSVAVPAAFADRDVLATARVSDARRAIMPAAMTVPARAAAPATAAVPRVLTLSLDRHRYQPGDRAKLRIASTWPRGTALVTLERGAILAAHVVSIVAGSAAIDLPVGDARLAGLRATVSLVRGRTEPCCTAQGEDPGRPQAAWAEIDVPIDRTAAALAVRIDAPRVTWPGARTIVRVHVRDRGGRPVRGDVTVWAVDEGILALTRYELADPDARIYAPYLPGTSLTDSRLRLLGRRLHPWLLSGSDGGAPTFMSAGHTTEYCSVSSSKIEEEPSVRRDLRPLAFWSGAVATDADGVAEIEATLPDTLTTYRIMAVAADAKARYGRATAPLLVNKPLMVRPATPRFLTRLDDAELRTTIAASGVDGTGTVVVESLTPALLRIDATPQPVTLADGGRAVSSVRLAALAAGAARIRITAALGDARDVLERDLPIVEPVIHETSAAAGEAAPRAVEAIALPAEADPRAGGLDLDLATTMLVGLSAAGDYVEHYPYLCAEQTASRALVLVLSSMLGRAFTVEQEPTTDPARRAAAQQALDALGAYRCNEGTGYAYWAGGCHQQSPYLTAYVLYVLQTAVRHGFVVPEAIRTKGADALEHALSVPPTRDAITDDIAWRALAVKVLVDSGRRPTAAMAAAYAERDRLPIWALAHMVDALHHVDASDARAAELQRRIRNALTAGVSAHVAERASLSYAWTWPSNAKSTGIALDALARTGALSADEARSMATWLLGARRKGIWSGTQENVWALVGLSAYQRAFEAARPSSTTAATVTLGGADLVQVRLEPKQPVASRAVPMPLLQQAIANGAKGQLVVASDGDRIFYTTRLVYRLPAHGAPPLQHGLAVTRAYAPVVRGVDGAPATTFAAGDLVRVTLTVDAGVARTFVAVSDPLPAGFEPVDTTLATTAVDGAIDRAPAGGYWNQGFDRTERYDQRVDLFATSLPAGRSTVSYLARATTPGTFFAAPTNAEAMYEPEIAGRGAGTTIVVMSGR